MRSRITSVYWSLSSSRSAGGRRGALAGAGRPDRRRGRAALQRAAAGTGGGGGSRAALRPFPLLEAAGGVLRSVATVPQIPASPCSAPSSPVLTTSGGCSVDRARQRCVRGVAMACRRATRLQAARAGAGAGARAPGRAWAAVWLASDAIVRLWIGQGAESTRECLKCPGASRQGLSCDMGLPMGDRALSSWSADESETAARPAQVSGAGTGQGWG